MTVSELADGVTVNGSDFPAGTAVALSIGGTDAGTATTASDGTFSTTASASVSPGTHTVTATAGGETATASIVVEADPIVYNPEITINPTTVTVSDLANNGVTVEGSDFPAGTAVALSIGGTDAGTATTASNGTFSTTASASVTPGTHTVTATAGGETATASIVVEADPIVYNPEISVTPSTVTVSELADGVTVEGSDFPASTAVALSIGGTDAGTATTASDGTFTATASASVTPGTHTVTATAGGETATASIVVEADPIVYNPEISVTPDTVTVSELANNGIAVNGEGFPADVVVTLSLGGNTAETTSGADGTFRTGISATLAPGVHTVTATSGSLSTTASITVEPNPVVYNPEITINPTTVTVSDLAGDGVTVNGSDFPTGTTVALSIGGTNAGTATTASDGTFSTTASASVSPGTHTVTATAGGESATSSLVVEADPVVVEDPEISVTPSTLTEDELFTSGVTVHGSDFAADAEVTLTLGDSTVVVFSDRDGAFTAVIMASLPAGTHTVAASANGQSASAHVEVTEDLFNPQLSVAPTELTVTDLADSGVTVQATGFRPSTPVTVLFDGEVWHEFTADADGNANVVLQRGNVAPGDHTITVEQNWVSGASWLTSFGELATSVTITVTADEPVYTPEIMIDLDEPTVTDLADGVTLSGNGFAPETVLTLLFDGESIGEVTTDADGAFSTVVALDGIEPGEYEIAVRGDDAVATTIITVVADDDDGETDPTPSETTPPSETTSPSDSPSPSAPDPTDIGSDDDASDELPVTGAGAASIAIVAIAALLVFGGALLARARQLRRS